MHLSSAPDAKYLPLFDHLRQFTQPLKINNHNSIFRKLIL